MRPRFRSEPGPNAPRDGRPVELVRVRRAQRQSGDEGFQVKARARRRGGRGRRRGGGGRSTPPPAPARWSFLGWLKSLFGVREEPARGGRKGERRGDRRDGGSLDEQEARVLAEFTKQYGITFRDPGLLKLALTHRSYLSVTGQGPRESNERLEFLGDSVLGLVTSEFLYRRHPDEHEGQLTKTKSLLVSKAILSRRALRMGLGRYVLMSHSEVESGGRQRLSILADAFESVLGAIYLDQGFEVARKFIHQWLLSESDAITSDKRHTNYKSHLQEYVQSTYRTHPVYRIRSEYGPDHSKHFMVEVMVGRRTLGEGRGHNKKEAEQAAARDALEKVEKLRREARSPGARPVDEDERDRPAGGSAEAEGEAGEGRRRRGRRSRRRDRDREAFPAEVREEAPLAGVAETPSTGWRVADEESEFEADDDEPVVEVFDDDEDDDEEDDAGEALGDREDDEDEPADEDEDEDEDGDEDEVRESRAVQAEPAEREERPAPAGTGVSRAVAEPARAPVSYGRSARRGASRAAPPAATEPPADREPAPPHEEALVDPFGIAEEAPERSVVDVPPAEPEDDREAEDRDARIDEIERAMANFGRQRERHGGGQGYGRRGRKR